MTDASSLLTVWKKIVATLRSILLCWSHYHRQENVIPNMMCSSLTPEIHHSNLSTAQLNSCLFIANRSWKVQEWAFSTFQPPSVAWYNYPPPFFLACLEPLSLCWWYHSHTVIAFTLTLVALQPITDWMWSLFCCIYVLLMIFLYHLEGCRRCQNLTTA